MAFVFSVSLLICIVEELWGLIYLLILKYHYVRDALLNAIQQAETDLFGLIHHSDRGCQYTYKNFIDTLEEYGIRPSMTQSGDPLENPIAERVNGILKKEWLNKYSFKTIEEVRPILEKAISYYNTRRPHMRRKLYPDFRKIKLSDNQY